jgi:hypothetical protein
MTILDKIVKLKMELESELNKEDKDLTVINKIRKQIINLSVYVTQKDIIKHRNG